MKFKTVATLKPETQGTRLKTRHIETYGYCQVFELGNRFKSSYYSIKNDKMGILLLILVE